MATAVAPTSIADIITASTLLERRIHTTTPSEWSLSSAAGRFTALEPVPESGMAPLSLLAGVLREAQAQQGLIAWIAGPRRLFFPPDLAASGVDLAVLPVVRVADSLQATRVAGTLLRSGSFAVLVLDVDGQAIPLALQTRLVGLAQQHHTALITLRQPGERPSRGSLVSLRGATLQRRIGHDCFACEFRAVKDKRRAPGWTHQELRHGPDGLC
jgi:recombination protein RecA